LDLLPSDSQTAFNPVQAAVDEIDLPVKLVNAALEPFKAAIKRSSARKPSGESARKGATRKALRWELLLSVIHFIISIFVFDVE
jgi:hypothetical protein